MAAQTGASGPYRSAFDLPSVVEMREQLRGLKLLTRFVARKQRTQVLQIESQLNELYTLVDDFYALLGPRHWIFHDSLDMTKVSALVVLSPDDAERALVEIYRDPETLQRFVTQLNRIPQLRARMPLIERAVIDYRESRYYSTVLVLIAVMDGFVNDLEPHHRRGLHARDESEMAAWDSVVGHHMGLSNAHKTFTKRFSKTSDEEVHELYRNGIVHGMLTNFDNDTVATKAWNRLFAVADWATSLQKQVAEPKAEPTWGELFQKIRANEETKRALDAWQPRAVSEGDDRLLDDPMFLLTSEYLTAWGKRNYGDMARLLSPLIAEETIGATAGMVREACAEFSLDGFEIRRLDFEAPAVCEVDVELLLNGETRAARMRWIRTGADGMAASPNQPAEWRLISWGPWAMINNASSSPEPKPDPEDR